MAFLAEHQALDLRNANSRQTLCEMQGATRFVTFTHLSDARNFCKIVERLAAKASYVRGRKKHYSAQRGVTLTVGQTSERKDLQKWPDEVLQRAVAVKLLQPRSWQRFAK